MKTKPVLTATELDAIVGAAAAKAGELGIAVSIAIVDDGGYPWRLTRADGAGVMTAAVATAKARTAALMRAPSGLLTARLKNEPELLRLTDYLPMPGGLPIKVDGQCVGGIGVSGGTGEQDVAIGEAALAVLG